MLRGVIAPVADSIFHDRDFYYEKLLKRYTPHFSIESFAGSVSPISKCMHIDSKDSKAGLTIYFWD